MWLALLKKEIQLLGRAKNGILSLFSISLSMIFIFYYAIGDTLSESERDLVGLKWAICFLVSYILIGQSVWEERESGAYRVNRGILPPYSYYLVKSFMIFGVLFCLEFFMILILAVLFPKFTIQTKTILIGMIYLLPGSLSLSLLGVALSSLSQSTRLKEMLLPVLQTPLAIPIFLLGMDAEKNSFATGLIDYRAFAILFLFCIFYGSVGAFILELDMDD
jgi:heme exporter protein B